MAFLTPDKIEIWNGVTVKFFPLTEHNPNNIAMPQKRVGACIGQTLHNTDMIKVNGTTMSEQYTRATFNGNMKDVRVHLYICSEEAWLMLPLDWQGWHAGQKGKADANGSDAGNAQTIGIECIMDGSGSVADLKAKDNAARIIAYLQDKYGGELYTHNYWCNLRNGKKGTIDELNKLNDNYKNCPIFIRPKWDDFKLLVNKYRKNGTKKNEMYYVQVGAFSSKANAEKYLASVKKDYPSAFIKVIDK